MAFVTILFGNNKLNFPMQYYVSLDDPFGKPFNPLPIIVASIIQILMEMFTDVMCACVEERVLHFPLLDAWSHIDKRKVMFVIFLSCLLSASYMHTVQLFMDGAWTACYNTDLCHCANGNGLAFGGLLEKYCLFLYPNTMGKPA